MTDQEIKDYIVQEINARLTKKRIPELSENITPLDGTFKTVVYNPHNNKTQWESLADFQTFMALGDGAVIPPDSASKGRYTFKVSAAQAGSDTLSLPQFAGKNFNLTIDAQDQLDEDYDVLNAGGIKMNIPGFVFLENMRLTLHFSEPLPDSVTNTNSSGIIKGMLTINTSTVLTSSDVRKLIQVRGGDTPLTIQFPDVSSLNDTDYILIEAVISNTKQHSLTTQGGQLFYLNNSSMPALHLSYGESALFFRTSAGWVPFLSLDKTYPDVGHPYPRFKIAFNELLLKGQQVKKIDYPRLYQQAQTFGQTFVSKATYDTDPEKYRGCYVDIDTTYFQLPNLMNMALRGVESESGIDTNRSHNAPGGYQHDFVGAHTHAYKDRYWIENAASLPSASKKETAPAGTNAGYGSGDTDADNNTFLYIDAATDANAGEETTMKNIGIYWVTKI